MFHREISAAVRSALANFKPEMPIRVLDLGCGDASMTLPWLAEKQVSSYTGCDLSQPALNIARNQLEALKIPFQLICEDMIQVAAELPDSSIDVAFSSYAIHHLNTNNKQRLFGDISRLLNSGGCLILIDIFREVAEDRVAYMRNYMSCVRERWTNLSSESLDLVINHAMEYDFPEHPDFYAQQCISHAFNPGQRLAKHTWHEAWSFTKPK
ncbi:MAG: hypothetical protein RLY18_536 [Pseudomonadota bacterium]|jgi:ubiquinone/menaquinone biosynthesis C-methylase UbiE